MQINKIEANGAQTLDYIWVTNTDIDAELESVLNHISY